MAPPRLGIKRQSTTLTSSKAWLLGHIAGDGNVRAKSIRIWAGLDKQIADLCRTLFDEIYGADARINVHLPDGKLKHVNFETECSWISVVDDVRSFAPFGVTKWRVPDAVMTGSNEIKGAWLSGWFDADGFCKGNPARYVSASSVNREGAEQAWSLLAGFGIKFKIRVEDYSKQVSRYDRSNNRKGHVIKIHGRENLTLFAKYVGFRAEKKQYILEEQLGNYDEIRLTARLRMISENRNKGMKLHEIGTMLGFKGDNQRLAVRVNNIIYAGKKRGDWPVASTVCDSVEATG